MNNITKSSKILVTGARGGLGVAITRSLFNRGYKKLLTPSRKELNLLDQNKTSAYFKKEKPNAVIHLASIVFGLQGNIDNQMHSALGNTLINSNLFYAINLNSSSIQYIFFAGTVASYPYPYNSLPLKEGDFFNGLPHQGEFGYAMAKKHAYTYLKILSETKFINYTYGIFTNLYGENDRFDQVSGHVIPSLIVKAFNAKQEHQPLDVWGDGSAIRDFLHFEDASEASIKCMLSASPPRLVNISSNAPVKIKYIATIIAKEAKIKEIKFLNDKPTGIPVRMIDNNIITSIGFKPKVDLSTGLKNLYHWYSKENLRCRK